MAQDMPPPGGFGQIPIQRTLAKPLIKQGMIAAIMLGLTINGFYLIRKFKLQLRILKIEQMEHYIASHPFMVAEQERKFLLHLRELRDQERELMKDHPGWIVGTLYGERLFKTLPEGALPPINASEFTAHRPLKDWIAGHNHPDLYL